MKNIELELKEYILNYCITNNIPIDLRFRCFGDENKFYTNNTEFSVNCVSYFVVDIEDIKNLFVYYLDTLCKYCKRPINKIALYVEDIIDMGSWYKVTVGICLFVDDALT